MDTLDRKRLDAAELKRLLSSDHRLYYRTPELNDKLYIHFKGYEKIEGLEGMTGLKMLFAEANGFSKIEGLDKCTLLRSLYLHDNAIRKIENLSHLTDLRHVNLSGNMIEVIENLEDNGELTNLIVSKNQIGRNGISDVVALKNAKSVSVLDLSDNEIKTPEIVSEVLAQMTSLSVLYLKGNPVCREIANYRKTMICGLSELKYLDDRPVFPADRRLALAFGRGGLAEERKEKQAINDEAKEQHRANHKAFEDMIEKARTQRRQSRIPSTLTQADSSDSSSSDQLSSDVEHHSTTGVNPLLPMEYPSQPTSPRPSSVASTTLRDSDTPYSLSSRSFPSSSLRSDSAISFASSSSRSESEVGCDSASDRGDGPTKQENNGSIAERFPQSSSRLRQLGQIQKGHDETGTADLLQCQGTGSIKMTVQGDDKVPSIGSDRDGAHGASLIDERVETKDCAASTPEEIEDEDTCYNNV
eukprot:GHVQ01023452.1.p1 GENE.GHVQ01023452.1~~GHVQ01023452.1.p1  ORF type:complete len:472 (+),score=54.12 GHVQ01023452.1:243-1658(+)